MKPEEIRAEIDKRDKSQSKAHSDHIKNSQTLQERFQKELAELQAKYQKLELESLNAANQAIADADALLNKAIQLEPNVKKENKSWDYLNALQPR